MLKLSLAYKGSKEGGKRAHLISQVVHRHRTSARGLLAHHQRSQRRPVHSVPFITSSTGAFGIDDGEVFGIDLGTQVEGAVEG